MYKLIIVDDETLELKLLREIVNWESLGFTLVDTFNNASVALDFLSLNQIDLIITDIKMPGMDGIEFVSKAKELSPDTLAVFISAHADFEYARKALLLSVVDYILKPIAPQNVLKAVENAKGILDSRLSENDYSDISLLSSQQALYEYFTGASGIDTLVEDLKSTNCENISIASCVAVLKITIAEFTHYLKENWKYGADKVYTAILNIANNNLFYCIPVNYSFNIMDIVVISKEYSFESFEKALNSHIENICQNAKSLLLADLSIDIISSGENMGIELEKAKKYFNFPTERPKNSVSDYTAVQRAINYINLNYHKDLTLSEIAEYVYLSPYHFSKVFKAKTGEKYIDYLNKVRIEKAKELLAKSNIKITNICIKAGYNSKTHFHKMFKLFTGMTPQEYRNAYYEE